MTKEELEYLAATASRMHLLQQTEGWDEYRKQLADLEARQVESLIKSGADTFAFRQGIIDGLRQAAHLPDLLIEAYRKATAASPQEDHKVRRVGSNRQL